ncbi:MBL fold metallo-hydrolase [Sphingobium sp. Sx8-8]|uniref:MBL fold metallo-hydrolase n=1 Tax=Sphingobium sp. Sx8-8 TaxID=2933617 RepID=UPI001F59AE02|nr:MBL fold metallo-hydrolase [Sphingobium sp. Sx8-8]
MAQWTMGDVRITTIDETVVVFRGDHFFPKSTREEMAAVPWLGEPYITKEGRVRLVIRAFLIETPQTKIIVDTCFGNDKPRHWADASMLQTDFLGKLEAAGCPRESIDAVLCTHLHIDHVGWNTMWDGERWVPTFPNARYMFARTEFEHWQAHSEGEELTVFEDSVKPVFDAGLVDLVTTDHRVDPWISLTPSHGHTPGHVCVLVDAGGVRSIITGDSFHSPMQIARPDWGSVPDWDTAMGEKTRLRILGDLAGTDNRMFGTHFPEPAAGHIVREGDGYRFAPLDGAA